MKRTKCLLALGLVVLVPAFSKAGFEATPENDYRKGLELYTQGRYEAALVRFEMAIDGNWNFWQAYQMVGYCYFELREKEGALQAFEDSLKIHADNPKLAKIYDDLKDGTLDIPVRPVETEPQPIGTPVYIHTYYTFNK